MELGGRKEESQTSYRICPQFYLNSVWDGIPDIPNVSLLQGNDSSSDGEV